MGKSGSRKAILAKGPGSSGCGKNATSRRGKTLVAPQAQQSQRGLQPQRILSSGLSERKLPHLAGSELGLGSPPSLPTSSRVPNWAPYLPKSGQVSRCQNGRRVQRGD